MKEVWKDVKGFEGLYEVSSLGRIRTIPHNTLTKTGKIYPVRRTVLKPSRDGGGYLFVVLRKDGKSYNMKIHRAVANVFCEKPSRECKAVNHMDEDIENNCCNNLEWVTNAYNLNYGHRRTKETETRGTKIAQYTKRGALVAIYPSIGEASRQTGINRSCIAAASRHKTSLNQWGHRHTGGGFVWKRGSKINAKWNKSTAKKEFLKKEYDQVSKQFVDKYIFKEKE